jgi:hypothetical protein
MLACTSQGLFASLLGNIIKRKAIEGGAEGLLTKPHRPRLAAGGPVHLTWVEDM